MLTLGACTPPPAPTVGPWGYDFTLGKLTDTRTPDDTSLMEGTPFQAQAFMQAWRDTVARTPVVNEPALLDIVLKKYEATHSGASFSISMEATLQARTTQGKPITKQDVTCSAVETRGFELGDFAQQVIGQQSLTPLTTRARDATMWQKVLTSCVRELATSFGNTLNSVGR